MIMNYVRAQYISTIAALFLTAITCLGACAITKMERDSIEWSKDAAPFDFTSACSVQASSTFCQELEKTIFQNSLPVQESSTHDFMVADFPTDPKTLLLTMYNPNFTAAFGYCYFVSKGIWNNSAPEPTEFGKGVHGFAIQTSELTAYDDWLKTDNGVKCRQDVANSTGLPLADLNDKLKGKFGLVVLNPMGMAVPNAELQAVMNTIKLTLNHERIHILQTACPAVHDFALELWTKSDPQRKAELKKQFPNYNWENQRVALREFLAFTYEKDPAPLLDIAKRCKF
jgi:hypothetical protein